MLEQAQVDAVKALRAQLIPVSIDIPDVEDGEEEYHPVDMPDRREYYVMDRYTHVRVTVKERIKMCSHTWVRKTDPRWGRLRTVPFLCGRFRLCPHCRDVKAWEIAGRVFTGMARAKAEHDSFISMVQVSKTTADHIVTELGKDNILRIPGNSLDVIFLPESLYGRKRCYDLGAKRIYNREVWENLPWSEYIGNMPARRNISGGLGRMEKDKKGVLTIQEAYVTDGRDREREKAACRKAFDRSVYKNVEPHTQAELQQMLEERSRLIKEEYDKAGIKVLCSYTIKEYVELKDVHWGDTYGDDLYDTG